MEFYGASAKVTFEITADQLADWKQLTENDRKQIKAGWLDEIEVRVSPSGQLQDITMLACPLGIGDGATTQDEAKSWAFSWFDRPVETFFLPLRRTPNGVVMAMGGQQSGTWSSCGRGCHISHKQFVEIDGNSMNSAQRILVEFTVASTEWIATVGVEYKLNWFV